MSKVFVLACSLGVFVSFVLFCYLLTTVNPPKLNATAVVEHSRRMLTDLEAEKIIAGRSEDVSDSLAPFYRFGPSNLTRSSQKTEKSIFILPYTVKVSPPNYPPCALADQSIDFAAQKTECNITLAINNTDSKSSSVKGHRRSINNYENNAFDGNSGSVIFKIIDDDGRPRIEIILNPSGPSRNGKNEMESGTNLRLHVRRNSIEDNIGLLEYNTEIKILPNDTVVIGNNTLFERKNDSVNDIFDKRSDRETKSNLAHGALIPDNTNKVTHKTTNVLKEIKGKSKRLYNKTVGTNGLGNKSLKYIIKDALGKKSNGQNGTDPRQKAANSFYTVAKVENKAYGLNNNTIKVATLKVPALFDNKTNSLNDIKSEHKNQHEPKHTGKMEAVTSTTRHVTREIEGQYDSKNKNAATKGHNEISFELKVLFDNETKSFSESHGIKNEVESANIAAR